MGKRSNNSETKLLSTNTLNVKSSEEIEITSIKASSSSA